MLSGSRRTGPSAGGGRLRTAAQRASRSHPGGPVRQAADSGYLATASDVGFIGLALELMLFTRIAVLLRSAVRRGEAAAWFGLGILVIFLLDAALRSSLTGFPTAHLAFLLLGLTISATSAPPLLDRPGARQRRTT